MIAAADARWIEFYGALAAGPFNGGKCKWPPYDACVSITKEEPICDQDLKEEHHHDEKIDSVLAADLSDGQTGCMADCMRDMTCPCGKTCAPGYCGFESLEHKLE